MSTDDARRRLARLLLWVASSASMHGWARCTDSYGAWVESDRIGRVRPWGAGRRQEARGDFHLHSFIKPRRRPTRPRDRENQKFERCGVPGLARGGGESRVLY